MGFMKIASLTVMASLVLLGLIGLVSAHNLIMQDVRYGLLDWQNDQLFLILGYGIPIILTLFGGAGIASILGFRVSLKRNSPLR